MIDIMNWILIMGKAKSMRRALNVAVE